jgi:cation transporter-like permease
MVWGIIAFVVGIAYGWLARGRQDKSRLFVTALIWGFVIALVLALIGLLVGQSAIGLGQGVVGFFISVLIISLLFILGVWIGDLIEGASKRRRTA